MTEGIQAPLWKTFVKLNCKELNVAWTFTHKTVWYIIILWDYS